MRVFLGRTVASCLLLAGGLGAQEVPTPASFFGFEIGAHRTLADWTQLTSYYEEVAKKSPRVRVDTLGATTMGAPFIMLTVTSSANQARLEELRDVQLRLADPRRVSGPSDLADLLDRGRTVVLITHGIHATEVGGSQMAARLIHRLATSNDPEIRQILDEVILLDIPSLNPDGLQWVADWYDRWVGTEFEAAPLPWLYHYYVGHDNNRDWYAFTQVETQLTIRGAHNAWHPQVVHDIHQMGGSGARIFFPPYVDPFERNIDPALISAVNQLGSYMAADLAAQGKRGVVTSAQYDGFTPARAYQHYHGGARILSETASARLASPVEIPWEELSGRRGFEATTPSMNFPWPWPGGEWGLPDIVDYMEAGALALLKNAARNRPFWLRNFYEINRRAVERWESWPEAWILPANQENRVGLTSVVQILTMGDVEVRRAERAFTHDGREYPAGTFVVPMNQPYASFAQTMLEVQEYPDLREYPGGPPVRPYDVTAHTLPLLMDMEAVAAWGPVNVSLSAPVPIPDVDHVLPPGLAGDDAPRVAMYKSWDEPMTEGWTRFVFDQHGMAYDTLHDADVRRGGLEERYDVIVLQSQSTRSIREGLSADRVPAEYAGGLGDVGLEALNAFVRNGGRLVAVEEATDVVIELFDLGVANRVERLPSEEFYIPGSILGLELTADHPLEATMPDEVAAWYWRSSRAFDVTDTRARVLARYAEGSPLRSGWLLGPEHVAGQAALVEAGVGRGSVVLFGFQPNYRAQTISTWPLLFQALIPEN
jgi:hypothetical protein